MVRSDINIVIDPLLQGLHGDTRGHEKERPEQPIGECNGRKKIRGRGGDLVREIFCPEEFRRGKIPPQSLKVMGKIAPHFSMVKGKA